MDATAFVTQLQEAVPGVVLEPVASSDLHTTLYVSRDELPAVARALRDRPEWRFGLLAEVTAIDFWPREPRFELVYIVISIEHRARVRLKVRLHGGDAHIATMSGVWPSANWLEREVWDMFGIIFDGHPDPRRLLMPEDWEGYPLRKDYPVQIAMTPRTTEPMQVTEQEFRANLVKDRLSGADVEATDDYVGTVLADAIALHRQFAAADLQPVYRAAATIADALRAGGKLLVLGNGGSAADAQHVAAELVGRFERVRRPMAAIALTADTSVMTSVANDEGYAEVFVRQVEALGRAGDVVLAISTSGRSPNVIAALKTARLLGLRTIALTGGGGGDAVALCDVHVNVPAENTARVQEVHRTLLHAICGLVEQAVG